MVGGSTTPWAAFWALQLGGWAGYALSKLLAFPVTLFDCGWIAVKGIALTSALRAALRWLEQRDVATAFVLVAAGALALLAALASLLLSQQVAAYGWVLAAPGVAQWLASAEAVLYEFLLFATWIALYLGIRRGLALQSERDRLGVALAEARQARVQMLRYQINPHFLFNALASLRSLVVEDGERARKVVDELSGFLRHSLLDGAAESTTLAREFDAIRHYTAIQKLRFEERVEFEIDLDPTLGERRMPAFLIQPLVENAVKYGMRTTRGGPARVAIRASESAGRCVVEVRNSGHWLAQNPMRLDRSGIGLPNVRARVAEHFGGDSALTVGPVPGGVLARLDWHDT